MKTSLYVQIIRASWTKKSRGGELATPRNAVPLALPIEELQSGYLLAQQASYAESDSFQHPVLQHQRFELTDDFHFKWGGFVLTWDGQIARTEFHPSDYFIGAPGIKSTDPHIGHIIVKSNEWMRLRWQGRCSDRDTGMWWYKHICINVARFDGEINPFIFLKSEPTRQFVHLPHLR